MNNTSVNITLASLRARRDRELIAIIESKVERGLDVVGRHSTGSANDSDRAEAEQALREAATLLPLVYSLSEPERRRLDARLAELQSALQIQIRGPNLRLERTDGHESSARGS